MNQRTLAKLVNQEIRDPALCLNCSKVYEDLRSFFWEKVVPSSLDGTLRGVCYDLRDRFNLTGQIWKETFDCEPMPSSWKFVLPVIFCTFLIILLTYVCEPKILPHFFPSRVQETVALGKICYRDLNFSLFCCLFSEFILSIRDYP